MLIGLSSRWRRNRDRIIFQESGSSDRLVLVDGDRINAVAALGLIDDATHPFVCAREDRIATVEMRLRRVRDEELRAAGIGTGERHADGGARVFLQVDLIAD